MWGFNWEPALIAAALRSLLLAAALFGASLSPEQIAGIMVAAEAILAIVVRQNVTSQNTLQAAGTSQKEVAAKAAANSGK